MSLYLFTLHGEVASVIIYIHITRGGGGCHYIYSHNTRRGGCHCIYSHNTRRERVSLCLFTLHAEVASVIIYIHITRGGGGCHYIYSHNTRRGSIHRGGDGCHCNTRRGGCHCHLFTGEGVIVSIHITRGIYSHNTRRGGCHCNSHYTGRWRV